MDNLDLLQEQAIHAIKGAQNLAELEQIRIDYLGKNGRLTTIMRGLGALALEERKQLGVPLNHLRDKLTSEMADRQAILKKDTLNIRLQQEKIDITLPSRPEQEGKIHPLTTAMDTFISIFSEMGFKIAEGPEVEDDFHNFTALNIGPEHPARQLHDTFYLPGEREGRSLLLRTHTSPVQIRTLLKEKPPIRIMAPGRVYRADMDQTHTPNFYQMEGLVIENNIHMGHLKGCIMSFCQAFFGISHLPIRFRPHFFPFTEPSAEVDIGCRKEGGQLIIGEGHDWLEVLGCGMVHPQVIKNCGLDPSLYQGFAFGMGIERFACLKYGIPDLRSFYEPDLRWLGHYGDSLFKFGL